MSTDSVTLLDLLRNAGIDQAEFLRLALERFLQDLMAADVATRIGADRYERTPERTTQRNGHRDRDWETRLGTVHLQIPKLRQGSYFPSFLEPRRRSEQALTAVIQEAYVLGVSTRKVDELVQALGMTGLSKSSVSALCQGLDERVEAFRNRTLSGPFPYVWLDAKYLKVREGDRVLSMALVIATGVNAQGDREVLGCDVGPSEEAAFWTQFLRGLLDRGLTGVQLVISDAHRGLQHAIQAVFQGASWQRCRVHALRNLLATVPKSAQAMVAAMVRTIFVHPDKQAALLQLAKVAETLQSRFPQAATALRDMADDLLAFMSFPAEHWRQIYSTNPLERLNREIGRRTDVVGIFPNRTAALRLAGAVLMEQQDEWLAASRRYFSQESMAKVVGGSAAAAPVDTPAALMAQ
jgi:transposase-like protein